MHPLDILFWSCLSLGGVYMVSTLLMGTFSHGAGHAHDGGHAHVGNGHAVHANGHAHVHAHGHAHAHAHGHAHADAHAHGGHGDGAADPGDAFDILQYINPTFLSCLLFGFGGLGVLCRFLKMDSQPSLIWAAAGGVGFYMFAYMFVGKVFGAGTATSHNRRDSLVGLRAQVTAPIEGSRPGMVSYTVSGARQSLRAITDDEESIPTGAMVRIRKVEANTVHVMRIDS